MINGRDTTERAELKALFDAQDRMLGEARWRAEREALMRRADPASGLIHREQENALVAAPEAENWAGWEAWISAHQRNLKAEILDWIMENMPPYVCTYVGGKLKERDREIGSLKGENAELRGMLGSLLTRFDTLNATAETLQQKWAAEKRERQVRDETIRERSARIADLQRENIASHSELARKQRDQELAQRDHRIALLEQQLRMLMMHMGLMGLDPPKGL
jgi:hypothetical protein